MQATGTSFKAATLTMLVAIPVGVAAAYGLFVPRHKSGQIFLFC